VLAIASRGDIIVLAALLAAAAATRLRAIGSALACTAALVRWGSSSLGAIAGAQAVLGPAAWTGGGAAVASAWLAAFALLACVPVWPAARSDSRARWVATVLGSSPFAIAAADVSVGPAPGGALLARVLASLVAIAVAVSVTRTMSDRRRERARSIAALVFGAAAVVLAGVSG
jgi:hypothetical protein